MSYDRNFRYGICSSFNLFSFSVKQFVSCFKITDDCVWIGPAESYKQPTRKHRSTPRQTTRVIQRFWSLWALICLNGIRAVLVSCFLKTDRKLKVVVSNLPTVPLWNISKYCLENCIGGKRNLMASRLNFFKRTSSIKKPRCVRTVVSMWANTI